MSDTFKKLIKYLVILALLGAVMFFGIKILFPTPSSTLAYEKSKEVVNNEHFEEIKNANLDFIDTYSDTILDDLYELSYSLNVVESQLNFLNIFYEQLAFAKNSSIYNTKANDLKKQGQAVAKAFQKATDYIENDFSPSPQEGILKALKNNLLKNNKEISKTLTTFINTASTIYNNLETNFTTNAYSKKVAQITTTWINVQNNFLKNNNADFNYQNAQENLTLMSTFISEKLDINLFHSYTLDKEEVDLFLQRISKANLNGLLSTLKISDIEEFINSIENEEIKNSTIALKTYILGGV